MPPLSLEAAPTLNQSQQQFCRPTTKKEQATTASTTTRTAGAQCRTYTTYEEASFLLFLSPSVRQKCSSFLSASIAGVLLLSVAFSRRPPATVLTLPIDNLYIVLKSKYVSAHYSTRTIPVSPSIFLMPLSKQRILYLCICLQVNELYA